MADRGAHIHICVYIFVYIDEIEVLNNRAR